ncbi:MAG: hypothetical protein LBU90_09390 [Bacteroidales bacterium]|jgi:hypothetical protein|nr:hypothetical protein [Bacteroidales bacterium]
METMTIQYNPDNSLAQSIIDSIKSSGVFKISTKKSPYNPEFVEKIQKNRLQVVRGETRRIQTADVWK